VVLVDKAAEAIAAVDIAAARQHDLCRFGLSKCEPAVCSALRRSEVSCIRARVNLQKDVTGQIEPSRSQRTEH
jgi:hypothetical protein